MGNNMEDMEKAYMDWQPSKDKPHLLLWAKSAPYKQLLAHMLDTGNCISAFLSGDSSDAMITFLCEQWHCEKKEAISYASYLAAMHDIGKAMPQFQSQDEQQYDRLIKNGLKYLFTSGNSASIRHEYFSARISKRIWKQRKIPSRLYVPYACVLSLHHQRMELAPAGMSVPDEWQTMQNALEEDVRDAFHVKESLPKPTDMDAVCIFLTGMIILCDWVASSEPFDPLPEVYSGYMEVSRKTAETTMRNYGLTGDQSRKDIDSFHSVWPQIELPRDIQLKCEQTCPDAPITIIEAPMGEGKTEAALYLAERMCSAWNKRGIYVALPTQATSNQMFGRVKSMLNSINGGKSRLLYGTAFLQEEKTIQSDDAQEAGRWLGPLRMGLLDENGVGTVDQAMAGVLRARFSVLRLLGLTNKTLVVDELHAYDAYMSKIIQTLLKWCMVLHIPVILLSATLQESQRKSYLSCYTSQSLDSVLSNSYPLITQVDTEGNITQIEASASMKTVYRFAPVRLGQDASRIAQYAFDRIGEGGCYCILVNTVGQAQKIYRSLRTIVTDDTELMLFHARFPVGRRGDIENKCLNTFGKGRDAKRPGKAILVATQVVEQSLDIDFDGMLTELVPIDLLLQRAGRVHRHRERKRPKGMEEPVIQVILPSDEASQNLEERFGSTGLVYAPFLLNNTERLVENGLKVHVPDDVRSVIAKVYDQITQENNAVWMERAFNQQLMQANAEGVSFPDPVEDIFFAAETHPEMLDIEVDDGLEPASRATTRLGEPTLRVAFVNDALLEKAKNDRLSKEEQKEVFLSSVSVSARFLSRGGTDTDMLYRIKKGTLKGCLLSGSDDKICFEKRTLINDPVMGVLWKEE